MWCYSDSHRVGPCTSDRGMRCLTSGRQVASVGGWADSRGGRWTAEADKSFEDQQQVDGIQVVICHHRTILLLIATPICCCFRRCVSGHSEVKAIRNVAGVLGRRTIPNSTSLAVSGPPSCPPYFLYTSAPLLTRHGQRWRHIDRHDSPRRLTSTLLLAHQTYPTSTRLERHQHL